jgi:hypothetical protein
VQLYATRWDHTVTDGIDTADLRGHPPVLRRDGGTTFIEMLVAIVLLGTAVIAVLVALQATTTASVVDADHSRAYIYLHEASDAIFLTPRMSCLDGTPADLMDHYDDGFALLTKPEGWESVMPVITKIEFLNASDVSGSTVYTWGPQCFEGPVDADGNGTIDADEDFTETPLYSQKITISVTAPDGGLTKILETVKR